MAMELVAALASKDIGARTALGFGNVPPGAAGLSVLVASLLSDARSFLDTAPYVPTRAVGKTLDTTKETTLILTEAGREGIFNRLVGDFSAEIAADTAEALYFDAGDGSTGAWVRVHDGTLDVRWSGVATGGIIDDTAAAQAALDLFAFRSETTPSRLWFPPFQYLITDSLDCTQVGGRRSEIVGGNGIASAEIIVGYHGYGGSAKTGAVFQFGDEASPAYQTALAVNGFHFSRQNTGIRAPIAIQGAALAQSRIDNITAGTWNNIVTSLITPQNIRGYNWEFFGGGVSFAYKDASAITVTQSGNILTATGDIFSAADIGKTVAIWGTGSSSYRRKAVITGYLGPTQVTVAKSVTDATTRRLYFGSPFASISAAGTTLSADAPCFTANHVGLVIWIKGAGTNGGLLRAKISDHIGPTQVTIDTPAITTVTQAEFGTPSIEIYSKPGFGNGSSDVRLSRVQFEDHNGIGLCVYDCEYFHLEGKSHSEQTISTVDDYSISTIWADRWSGSFNGDWDAQYVGEHRSWIGNLTRSLHIPSLHTRTALDEVICYIGLRNAGFPGATVVFGDVSVAGADTTSTIRGDLLVDANLGGGIPGYSLMGTWTLEDQDRTTSFLGRSVYTDDGGNLAANSITFDAGLNVLDTYVRKAVWTPVVADAVSGGNVASGTFQGTYERVANQVTITADCRLINTTGMTGGNSLVIRGFPIPVAGGTNNRYIATVRVDNVTFTGYLTAYTDNGDSHFFIYTNVSGAPSALLTVAALASGTANIFISATFIA